MFLSNIKLDTKKNTFIPLSMLLPYYFYDLTTRDDISHQTMKSYLTEDKIRQIK